MSVAGAQRTERPRLPTRLSVDDSLTYRAFHQVSRCVVFVVDNLENAWPALLTDATKCLGPQVSDDEIIVVEGFQAVGMDCAAWMPPLS